MTCAEALRELELQQGAPEDEVRAAYKKMALRWHPDKNDSEEATEKFKRINCAYNTLSKVSVLRAAHLCRVCRVPPGAPAAGSARVPAPLMRPAAPISHAVLSCSTVSHNMLCSCGTCLSCRAPGAAGGRRRLGRRP